MNPNSSPLLSFAPIYFVIFGVITIIGGVMGYVKAGSHISLITGGIAGALLIVGALLLYRSGTPWMTGIILTLLISLALEGRFLPALLNGKLNPAAYIVPMSGVGSIIAVLLLVQHLRR